MTTIQGLTGWCSTMNNVCRNSGAVSCLLFGLEAFREWTLFVLIPAMAHPWLIIMLGLISAVSGLVHWLHHFRQHPVALAENISTISPALIDDALMGQAA